MVNGAEYEFANKESPAKSLFRWVSGDASNTTAVAIGSPVTTDPVDVAWVQDGSLFVVHTGGTLAVSYQVSEDGIDWFIVGPAVERVICRRFGIAIVGNQARNRIFPADVLRNSVPVT